MVPAVYDILVLSRREDLGQGQESGLRGPGISLEGGVFLR